MSPAGAAAIAAPAAGAAAAIGLTATTGPDPTTARTAITGPIVAGATNGALEANRPEAKPGPSRPGFSHFAMPRRRDPHRDAEAPGACRSFLPSGSSRRDGAPKSANLWLASEDARAPLGAPHALALKQRSGSATNRVARPQRSVSACYLQRLVGGGPRFRRQCPASPATDRSQNDVGGLRLDPGVKTRGSRPEIQDLTVVSQLLAGPRNGHGGSPAAARVPGCEPGPRGAAPRPASTNASRNALKVDEVMRSVREAGGAGISFGGTVTLQVQRAPRRPPNLSEISKETARPWKHCV